MWQKIHYNFLITLSIYLTCFNQLEHFFSVATFVLVLKARTGGETESVENHLHLHQNDFHLHQMGIKARAKKT